jgi:hypothetical protein
MMSLVYIEQKATNKKSQKCGQSVKIRAGIPVL